MSDHGKENCQARVDREAESDHLERLAGLERSLLKEVTADLIGSGIRGYGDLAKACRVMFGPVRNWYEIAEGEWVKACPKCGGSGDHWQTRMGIRQDGDCFRCSGSGLGGMSKTRTEAQMIKEINREVQKANAEIVKHFEANEQILKEEAAREEERKADAKARRDSSSHLSAEVGEKVNLTGVVTLAKSFEVPSFNGYGMSRKMIIALDLGAGVTVKMFTAAAWAFSAEKGETLSLVATVKKHGEYNGVKETEVNRPRLAK